MNHKSTIHIRIFNRLNVRENEVAQRIVSLLHDLELLDDARFGSYEPLDSRFDPNDKLKMSEIWSKQFDLIIRNSKKQFSAFFTWYPKREHPWFWTMDFGKSWLSEKKRKSLRQICQSLVKEFDIDLLSSGLSQDWFEKHEFYDEHGEMKNRHGAGMEIGKGLPGIYWFNGFGRILTEKFGENINANRAKLLVDLRTSEALCFRPYEAPNSHNPEERRLKESEIVDILGSEYFFDLEKSGGKRPRKRKPIVGITDANKL